MAAQYAVQGYSVRLGGWKTLFAPYDTEVDANVRRDSLAESNPVCSYRTVTLPAPDMLINRLGDDQRTAAERKWNAPTMGKAAQKSCDIGLFSDDSKQGRLI